MKFTSTSSDPWQISYYFSELYFCTCNLRMEILIIYRNHKQKYCHYWSLSRLLIGISIELLYEILDYLSLVRRTRWINQAFVLHIWWWANFEVNLCKVLEDITFGCFLSLSFGCWGTAIRTSGLNQTQWWVTIQKDNLSFDWCYLKHITRV